METKLAARRAVHATFQRAARFYPTQDVSGEGVVVSVRVHGEKIETGDLDREGYSHVVDEVETMILLRSEVDANTIRRNTYVKMDDDGVVYRLDLREKTRDIYTVTFQVVRVE